MLGPLLGLVNQAEALDINQGAAVGVALLQTPRQGAQYPFMVKFPKEINSTLPCHMHLTAGSSPLCSFCPSKVQLCVRGVSASELAPPSCTYKAIQERHRKPSLRSCVAPGTARSLTKAHLDCIESHQHTLIATKKDDNSEKKVKKVEKVNGLKCHGTRSHFCPLGF